MSSLEFNKMRPNWVFYTKETALHEANNILKELETPTINIPESVYDIRYEKIINGRIDDRVYGIVFIYGDLYQKITGLQTRTIIKEVKEIGKPYIPGRYATEEVVLTDWHLKENNRLIIRFKYEEEDVNYG